MPYLSAKRSSQFTTLQILGIVIFASLAFMHSTQAENWTRFRGPNGMGHAAEAIFPGQWSDQDYLWKIQLPGLGHSSPVGWENHLFLTSGDPDTGEVTLHCFDATTGDALWHRDFSGEKYPMHASNSYASTTPTVDQDRVYMTWSTAGKMHCVALTHRGKEVWRTDLGQFVGHHGFAASPIVVDGVVCMQVDHADRGFLAGIEATTGKIRWQAERPAGKASYATPCVVSLENENKVVISQSMTGGLQALDLQTGEQRWQMADLFPARCVSSPFVADDMIIGVCGGGGSGKVLVGAKFSKDPAVQGAENLVLTKHIPYVPTPLVKNQWLFLWHDQGKVSCANIQADDPAKVEWTKRVGGKYFGSPILAGDKIYCLSTDGRAMVLAAGPEYLLLGETDLGAPSNATPAVHQGRMYLRTESSLACLPAQR